MGIGPQEITYGNVVNTFVLTVTLTPVATAATTTAEQNFTIPGLQLNDQISDLTYIGGAFPNTLLSVLNVRVSAANTLTVAVQNGTAGSLTYPAGKYYLEVNRPDSAVVMSSIQ
jgi:hypothetical protein